MHLIHVHARRLVGSLVMPSTSYSDAKRHKPDVTDGYAEYELRQAIEQSITVHGIGGANELIETIMAEKNRRLGYRPHSRRKAA